MSDPSMADIAARLDDVLKEVRRQGRAAIAAQAAAESCLEAVRAQAPLDDDDEGEDVAVRWLKGLIPVADAVERVMRKAASPDASRPAPKRSLLGRILGGSELSKTEGVADDDRGRAALAEGLRVLHSQLEGVLADLGVEVDRRTGGPVDAERQRVVEVRPARPGEQAGNVVEVVRPGYALGERVVREAEVVVAAQAAR